MQDGIPTYSLRLDKKGCVEIVEITTNGITPVYEVVQNAHALTAGKVVGEPPDVIVVLKPVNAYLGRNVSCARRRDVIYGDKVEVPGAFVRGLFVGPQKVVTLRLALPEPVARSVFGVTGVLRKAKGSSGQGMVVLAMVPQKGTAALATGAWSSGGGTRVSLE